MKEHTIVVKSEKERENIMLELVAKGYRTVMTTDDRTVMELKKRRTWLWILFFWPMLLFKVTKITTIKLENMTVEAIEGESFGL